LLWTLAFDGRFEEMKKKRESKKKKEMKEEEEEEDKRGEETQMKRSMRRACSLFARVLHIITRTRLTSPHIKGYSNIPRSLVSDW